MNTISLSIPRNVLTILAVVAVFAPSLVSAEPKAGSALSTTQAPASSQVANVSCTLPKTSTSFLSIPRWYEYIKTGRTDLSGKCTIPDIQLTKNGFNGSGILLVLLAIVDILLRLSGLVAVGFVVYGGISFVTSQGSSDGTKHARETVINALIGLVIATVAIALVTFLGDKIG